MMEMWAKIPIKEFNYYEVSNIGKVRNGNRTLKTSLSHGYPAVTLCNNGYRRTIRVYRLVALAFIENPKKLPCINHKDGNKLNTHVGNLEWCTYGQNTKHAWEHGLKVFTEKMRTAVTKTILEEVDKQKKKVGCLKNGNLVAVYESACEAARQINGSQPHISDCCNGKRKTHKGYGWKWVNAQGEES